MLVGGAAASTAEPGGVRAVTAARGSEGGLARPLGPQTALEAGAVLDAPVPLDLVRPFRAPPTQWGAGHRGVDLASEVDAVVRSPGAGVVTFAGTVVNRGVVVVAHPNGLRSSLEPIEASVEVGQVVAALEEVGRVQAFDGQTARSHCAPSICVHWGVRRGEVYVDPLDVLRGFGPVRLLPLTRRRPS